MVNVTGRRRNDVEVVEQPLGGGRHAFSPGVLGECGVDLPQRMGVFLEAPQMSTADPATAARKRQERSQTPRVLLQRLNPQQFEAAAC
jgi:hypothetical protein